MSLVASAKSTAPHRLDARLKVTGGAVYTGDLCPPEIPSGLLHAVVVSSAVPAGSIRTIDVSTALASPRVREVITPWNAPRLHSVKTVMSTELTLLLPLQDCKICYKGQAIALVIADTLLDAQYAASLITAEYNLPDVQPELSFEDAIPRAEEAKKVGAGDSGTKKRGRPEEAFKKAAVQLDRVYSTAAAHHNAMEPGAAVAVWDREGKLTVHSATQFTYGDAVTLARVFGFGVREGMLRLGAQVAAGYELGGKVRVIAPFVGGGFGSKGENHHLVLAAMAAKAVGSPVKLVLTREQTYALMPYRGATHQRIRLGSDREGRLQATLHDSTIQNSKTGSFTEPAGELTPHLYSCPNLRTTHRVVRLYRNAPSWMRAPGVAPGLFALECAIDELAEQAGIDPLEMRLRNYADDDPETGHAWSSKSLRECYRVGAERIGWNDRSPRPASMHEGDLSIGFGMATCAYRTMQFPASARIVLYANGNAVVQSATHEIGQGVITVLTQIAAESIGLPVSNVKFEWGDAALPFAPMTAASSSTLSIGTAIQAAAEKLRQRLTVLAVVDRRSPLYKTRPSTIVMRDAGLYRRGLGESYTAILARRGMATIEAKALTGRMFGRSKYARAAFGAQFAKVSVHSQTGEIKVQHLAGAFAAGRIINPKLAESQLRGGMVWGIGQALMEETVTDSTYGGWVNGNLGEAHVPTNADVPLIEPLLVEEDDSLGSALGAKGIGEIGITGVAPAIANAVYHATGHRLYSLPIKPDALLRFLPR